MFSFVRNSHTVFQSGCAILHSHQWWMSVPVDVHPHQDLVVSVFRILTILNGYISQFSSVQSLSHVRLFATPWIAARQASLSITNSRSSVVPNCCFNLHFSNDIGSEKAMAPHSSTLAWKIPWTAEPGRLYRVRLDWSDLVAAMT